MGEAYERADEPSEFGFIPAYVDRLPYSEGGAVPGQGSPCQAAGWQDLIGGPQ